MENIEIKPSIKYKDPENEFGKSSKIQLTMDGDTPGYYSVNKNAGSQEIKKLDAVKRKRKLIKRNKEKDI